MSIDDEQVQKTLAKARLRHPLIFDAPAKRGGVGGHVKDKKARNDLEHQEQVAIVNHLNQRLRPGVYWFAVPNGGHRNKVTAARLKKEGVRAGVQDLHFLVPGEEDSAPWNLPRTGQNASQGRGDGTALYLEYKTVGGTLSPVQKERRLEVIAAGGVWMVAHGIDAALEILEQYGVIWPDKNGGVVK
jgi:hypothetical protein